MSTFDIKRLSKQMLADYQDYAKTGEDAIYWLVASEKNYTTDQIINRMQSATIERTSFSGLKTLGEWTASQYGPTQVRATLAPVSNTNKYSSFALVERSNQLGKLRYPLRHSFAATKPAFVKKTYATYTSMLRQIKQQYGIDVVETARFTEMFRYAHDGKLGGILKNTFAFSRAATPEQKLSERKKLDYAGTIYLNNNLRLANGIQYEISQQEKMTKIFDAIFEISVNQYAKDKPELALTNEEKFVARLIADVLMSRAIDFGDPEDNINAETSLTLQLSNVIAYLDLSPDRLKVCGKVGLVCAQEACQKMGIDINKVMQGMASANHTYQKPPQTLAEALAPINQPLDITFEETQETPEETSEEPVVPPRKPSPIDELNELLDTSKEDQDRIELAERLARLIQRVSDRKQEQQDEQRRKEEEARRAAEEEARRQEELRKKEEAERLAAEEEARRIAEEETRRIEEARRAEEEEARKKEEEARRIAREEERKKRKAEEEARRQAEEERRRKLEEEAQRLAEERKKLEQEQARLKAEEEARKKAEEEAKRKAEEEARRQEEERKKAEAEAKRKAEEEAKRKAEEKARRQEERRRKAEEARIAAEAEAKRKAEEEERKKKEEAKREEERKRLEEENRRLKAEEEARRIAEEEEAKKKIGKKSVLFGIKDKIYLKRKSAADYFDKIMLKSISSATDSIVKSRYAPSVSKKRADLLDRQYNFLDHMMSFYNRNKNNDNAEQIQRELTSEHGIADNNVAHAFANAFIELREYVLEQVFGQEDRIEKPEGKSIATLVNECIEEKFGSKLSTFANDKIKREIKEIFKQIDMNEYKATSFVDETSENVDSHQQGE